MKPLKIVLPLLLLVAVIFITILQDSNKETSDARVSVEVPEEYKLLENPILADEASLKEGERLYGIYCDTCHGKWGESGESVTKSFEVPPSPLSEEIIGGYTDGGHYYLIAKGVEGTNMRPFWELSDEERWHTINYMRTLHLKRSVLDKIKGYIS